MSDSVVTVPSTPKRKPGRPPKKQAAVSTKPPLPTVTNPNVSKIFETLNDPTVSELDTPTKAELSKILEIMGDTTKFNALLKEMINKPIPEPPAEAKKEDPPVPTKKTPKRRPKIDYALPDRPSIELHIPREQLLKILHYLDSYDNHLKNHRERHRLRDNTIKPRKPGISKSEMLLSCVKQ